MQHTTLCWTPTCQIQTFYLSIHQWKISCLLVGESFYRVTNPVTNCDQNQVIVFFVKHPDHNTNMRCARLPGNSMIG